MQTIQLFGPEKNSEFQAERTDENRRVYGVSRPSITVYQADSFNNKGAAIIICPGGGYYMLDFRTHVELVAPVLNRAGCTVFGLCYRTWPPSSNAPADALADLQLAVRVIRSRAAEWKINPNRLGVLGYSAGSHLALSLIDADEEGHAGSDDPLARISTRPDFAILLCPAALGRTAQNFHLSPNAPPMYIAHAADDVIAPVAHAKEIKQELDRMGSPAELKIFSHGGHNGFNFSAVTATSENLWIADVIAWLSGLLV